MNFNEINFLSMDDWDLYASKRLKNTRKLLEYLNCWDKKPGTIVVFSLKELKEELYAKDIQDKSFLTTLKEHLNFLNQKGYPKIKARKKEANNLQPYTIIILEWIK